MSDRAVRLAVVATMASAVIAGCTTAQPGQAAPAPTTGATTSDSPTGSSSAPTTPTVAVPPRPRELRLEGVDPCALFTEAQLTELKLDTKRSRTNESTHYKGMKECVLDANKAPFDHYIATAATNEGIAAWLTGKRNVEARLSSVAGYGAATYWDRGAKGRNTAGCSTAVDVAEGQQLRVRTDNDTVHSLSLEQLCQRAEQAAALAVKTLQTLK